MSQKYKSDIANRARTECVNGISHYQINQLLLSASLTSKSVRGKTVPFHCVKMNISEIATIHKQLQYIFNDKKQYFFTTIPNQLLHAEGAGNHKNVFPRKTGKMTAFDFYHNLQFPYTNFKAMLRKYLGMY